MSTSFQTPRPPTDPTNIPAAASLTTSNGVVWTLRARNAQGLALYAPATVRDCPRLVMATVAELAAHGVVSASDAAPEPAEPAADVRAPIIARTRVRRDDLDHVRARAAADREAYRAEMDERLAAEHRAHGAPVPASVQARIDARRAADGHREQIAQLEARCRRLDLGAQTLERECARLRDQLAAVRALLPTTPAPATADPVAEAYAAGEMTAWALVGDALGVELPAARPEGGDA